MEIQEENPIIQRLKEFIVYTGLSSTQFADKAGIPRPTLSQMVHGRNKSVNNQVLSRLDENFPELNIMWLLFGRGAMLTDSNFEISERQNSLQEPAQPQQTIENQNEGPSWRASVLCSAPDMLQDKSEVPSETRTINVDGSKRITSIIVLYSDNSFETFNPASDI